MVTAVITSKGQIVIPSAIRKRLHLKKGTRLCISDKGNRIVLQPLNEDYFEKAAGFLSSGGKLTKRLLKERRDDRIKEDKK